MKLVYLFILILCLFSCSAKYPKVMHPDSYISAMEISNQVGSKQDLLKENTESQFILSLPNGIVINEGGIVTNNGKILLDTQTSHNKDQHRLLKKGRNISNENPLYFKGKLAVISSPGQENWYHFLLQVLPRLKILKDSHIEYDKIYINNLKYQFQRESLNHILEVLQISQEKILEINGDVIIQAETLIVPSVPFIPRKSTGKTTALPNWLKEFLRNSFLNNSSFKLNKQIISDKIYVSRAKANIRHITNENELIGHLQNKGFKIVYLEELSPFEQAYLFNNAKIIIGPHGSGFTNLIFAQPKTKVIEIDHGSDKIRSFYKRFTEIMGCSYYPFYVDHVIEEHLEDDMYINVPKFIKYLIKINGS